MDRSEMPSSSTVMENGGRNMARVDNGNDATPDAAGEPQAVKVTEGDHGPILSSLGSYDPMIDPSSPSFDVAKWSTAVVNLRNQLGLPTPPRSGFVFRGLTVKGSGPSFEQRDTVWTCLTSLFRFHRRFRRGDAKPILQGLDGIVHQGELLLVLGRPGSGCTTFLKTIIGEMRGLALSSQSAISYRGIPHKTMTKQFKGELIYNQEVDEHFPYLTVRQTLEFAAALRTPRTRLPGVSREDRIKHVADVMLAVFGLSHARDTIVGNDYVRGVSGGERKRVSIAETALSEAAISAWDNSTRGLDAESALSFVCWLRTLSDLTRSSNVAALYQSSQAIVDRFDKILVLYEGRQIFFGAASAASAYFEHMGWHRHSRQTTGDFLIAVTNPEQREAREGFEGHVPTTPEGFEEFWRKSSHYTSLLAEIDQYEREWSLGGDTTRREFEQARSMLKAKWMLTKAAQTVSFPMQTWLCVKRAFQQLQNDKASAFTTLAGQTVIALVVASIFHGTPETTAAFFSYGSVLFFAVLINVLMAVTDIHNLYRGRSVIRKQVSYAFYRPSAEALASVLVDVPFKLTVAICFNIILYFLAGLAMTAAQFFIFFLFVFVTTLAMSMVFRTIATATATLPLAMAISGFLVLVLVAYTGFVLPIPYMHPWFKWISFINPLAYGFEALLVNQAHGVDYPCAALVPPYPDLTGDTFVCPVPGAVAGNMYVSGDSWFETSYGYSYSHLWRNLGIILAFFVFFLASYLLAAELNVDRSSDPDVLVFLRGRLPPRLATRDTKLKGRADLEASPANHDVSHTTANRHEQHHVTIEGEAFSWRNVCLDVRTKGGSRRLLDNVSGWVRPGTLTALMGVSGAGKTTLLNALAQRSPSGTTTGEFYVGGKPLTKSFKSDVAYVQQQDIHLETSTLREALRFSALLRQPFDRPKEEKMTSVEEIIHILDMDAYADAVIGEPGKGLNVEQRKRLSIGIELAAKPKMLIFLDEPTSGLDSQSSVAILSLLQRLAASGLAVLCTIHQPSAMLFQQFDRLLLMAHGGRVAYFGDIGENSEAVLRYFSDRGQRRCAAAENPAEYLLDALGNPDSTVRDWPSAWQESSDAKSVSAELDHITSISPEQTGGVDPGSVQLKPQGTYPVPMLFQIPIVCLRIFQQYWRSPVYIISKFLLGIGASLFIGFSFFRPGFSILGTQNGIFSVLMFCALFGSLSQQIMPKFIIQRSLYEARERHSSMYSWVVLIFSNILVEIPYHLVLGIISFAIFNYTVFGIRSPEDQGLVLLFLVYFYILAGTLAQMVVAALPDATTAGRAITILFAMMLLFAGVFQIPSSLPGFWIFMYRVSPMTYLVGGVAVSGLSGNPIVCSTNELAVFQPGFNETCGTYLRSYLEGGSQGRLLNPDAISDCSYCPLQSADQVLAKSGMSYSQRWMDWAVGLAYIAFNITCTFAFYYLCRVQDWAILVRRLVGRRR